MQVMAESARLDAIEIKLAHLEQSLQELGETVMRQQRDLDALSQRSRALQSQMETLEVGAERAREFEKPPHY